MGAPVRARRLAVALGIFAAACQPAAPRYAVTATPIDVGGGLPPYGRRGGE